MSAGWCSTACTADSSETPDSGGDTNETPDADGGTDETGDPDGGADTGLQDGPDSTQSLTVATADFRLLVFVEGDAGTELHVGLVPISEAGPARVLWRDP